MTPSMLICALLALVPADDPVALGPFGGEVAAVAGDPLDADFVLINRFPSEGLYRRVFDNGLTWTWEPTGAGLPVVSTSLERVPDSPTDLFSFAGGTLLASTDDGATWAPRAAGIVGGLEQLVVAPGGQHLLLLGGQGFSRSVDGGFSTQVVSTSEMVTDAAFAPSDPDIAYRVGPTGLFRSDDGGASWSATASGLTHLVSVAVDPADPDRLLVSRGPGSQALLLSEDGGATVSTVMSEVVVDIDWAPDGSVVHALRDVGTVARLYSSDDGGVNWSFDDFPFGLGRPRDMALTADGLALVGFDAVGGSEGGLFRGSATASVKRLPLFPSGRVDEVIALPGTGTVAAVALDEFLEPSIISGAPPAQLKGAANGPLASLNIRTPRSLGGERWIAVGDDTVDGLVFRFEGADLLDTQVVAPGGQPFEVHVAPEDRARAVVLDGDPAPGQPGARWSQNGGDDWNPSGGVTWSDVVARGTWDPFADGRLIVMAGLGTERLYQSFDHGQTFSPFGLDQALSGVSLQLVMDPFEPGRLLRLTTSSTSGSVVSETFDHATWAPAWSTGTLPIQELWFDPVGRGVFVMRALDELHLIEGGLGGAFSLPSPDTLIAADVDSFSVDPDDGSILIGSQASGVSWQLPGTGHGDLGGAGRGTDGIRPRHFGIGLPDVGTSWGLGVDRAVGGAGGLLFVGLAGTSQPLWDGALTVAPPFALEIPFTTSGAPGVGGDGAFEVTTTLPALASLVGQSIVSQVGLLDPTNPTPFDKVLSNGVRTTFR